MAPLPAGPSLARGRRPPDPGDPRGARARRRRLPAARPRPAAHRARGHLGRPPRARPARRRLGTRRGRRDRTAPARRPGPRARRRPARPAGGLRGRQPLQGRDSASWSAISPWTTVGDLSDQQVHDAVAWARKLLERNAWRPEQSTTGDLGGNAQHWVFERGGRGCRRCRDVVRTAGQAETQHADSGSPDREDRIAYFCPTCQPGPHPPLERRRGRRPQQQSGRQARYASEHP